MRRLYVLLREKRRETEAEDESEINIRVDSRAARSTMSLRQWLEIETRVTVKEWRQFKERKLETEGRFEIGRRGEGVSKAQFVGLLPIRVAESLTTLKWNVIDDDIPLMLGMEAFENLKAG